MLIAGATGLVGKLVLEQALADQRVSRVIALTRRPIASSDKLQNVVIDFSDMPGQAAWWSVDGVVSALGTTRAAAGSPSAYRAVDYDYPLAVARHARDHGATHFALTSSLGANPRSRFVYTRTKGELELELKKLGFPSLTIVRPSVLDGNREHQRLGERMANIIFRILAPVLPRRLRTSPASAVAASLIAGAIDAPPGLHVKHNEEMT
ncbi:MAG: NAD(P)H-binding protein [Candidatus Acidiferrales bacterium]